MRKLAWFLLASQVFMSGFVIICLMIQHDKLNYLERHIALQCHKEQ